ncbi:MAG: DEAD/DEAH box helicase family protein, partial [Lachnospiraceae bacterium]|nr:DEAD/DEAH box helicase family protein [Lachnospiraceae bacterium]
MTVNQLTVSDILQFKGKWRDYQARVLQRAAEYMKDGRVHIVAAPGSGKTTLGIELMTRLGKPALVLAPSITIREQWVARIEEAFLKDELNSADYLSQDIKDPKMITVATYQALHCAMTRYSGSLAGEQEEEEPDRRKSSTPADGSEDRNETVDFKDFDVMAAMKVAGIGVLCLDECHHLRSEWWKALEEFKAQLGTIKVIALTATPPYDSTPAMWKRYMDMCGEIDEEITIPELVKEGSLCPHQDYVYFNYPTEEETAEVQRFRRRSEEMFQR